MPLSGIYGPLRKAWIPARDALFLVNRRPAPPRASGPAPFFPDQRHQLFRGNSHADRENIQRRLLVLLRSQGKSSPILSANKDLSGGFRPVQDTSQFLPGFRIRQDVN